MFKPDLPLDLNQTPQLSTKSAHLPLIHNIIIPTTPQFVIICPNLNIFSILINLISKFFIHKSECQGIDATSLHSQLRYHLNISDNNKPESIASSLSWEAFCLQSFLRRFCYFCLLFIHKNTNHLFNKQWEKNEKSGTRHSFFADIVLLIRNIN